MGLISGLLKGLNLVKLFGLKADPEIVGANGASILPSTFKNAQAGKTTIIEFKNVGRIDQEEIDNALASLPAGVKYKEVGGSNLVRSPDGSQMLNNFKVEVSPA